MSLKNKVTFWKNCLRGISLIVLLTISGCSVKTWQETETVKTTSEVENVQINDSLEDEKLISICLELYKKAAEENNLDDLNTIRNIVNQFGENGYPAVDSRNQVDMTNAEQVIKFCRQVDAGQEAEITIIEVPWPGGVFKYEFKTKDGNVDVVKTCYKYENGDMKKEFTGSYRAEYWNYTEEGYLMFTGVLITDEIYALTLNGIQEHVALRVQPLAEEYRELNRKYLLPITYERNNMFIADWSEDDFGELDFYDIYSILYPKIYKTHLPYVPDDNVGTGAVYQIPKDEFEHVIMSYFNIDSETLQSKTIYYPESMTYEYKPRGFYEVEYPEYPYSEVVGYRENSDGTIALTVNVVFPYAGNSKVYAHEVVVRPMEDGGVQYVSNRIIPDENNKEATWHTPRLTDEKWEEIYGDNDCKRMMEFISDIYEQADKGGVNKVLSNANIFEMQNKLGETGYPVYTAVPYSNMKNHDKMEKFLEACENGECSSIVVYKIHFHGGIGRANYIFDGTNMYVFCTNAAWSENGDVEISYGGYTKIKEWKYSDKGRFCYKLCVPEYPEVSEIVDGSCLIRVKPMTEEQRELSEKCVRGIGYQGNNLLCSDWDVNHLETLDYNAIFEFLYAMEHQESFHAENYPNGIPKQEFESLIMEYFPITVEEIRKYAAFDEKNDTYMYVGLGCVSYAPTFFGTSLPEVTDVKENADGTVTLTVDAVCDMVTCNDAVITSELTVRLEKDGSFQYLGNKILNSGEKDIPEYQYRIRTQ